MSQIHATLKKVCGKFTVNCSTVWKCQTKFQRGQINFEDDLCRSLLEYKAMNVEWQRCIFVKLWSDSIHTALWRNNVFLHSFYDFSKNNAFCENLIRKKLILHRIFFQNEYTFEQQNLVDVLQFTLENKTSRFAAYNNYYCHDIGRNFEPIFMKFTWLVRVHTWMNPIFFGNYRSNTTSDKGDNVTPKLVFWLSFSHYGGFQGKNLKGIFNTPVPIEKVIFIFVVWYPIPEKWSCPTKIIFSRGYFGKYCFVFCFFEKIVTWKIFKTSTPTKKIILIFVARHPLPLKMVMSSHKWFSAIFST